MTVFFLKRAEVCSRMGWARSTLYDKINAGLFPAAIRNGKRSAVWPDNEVSAIQTAIIKGASSNQVRELVAELTNARGTYYA